MGGWMKWGGWGEGCGGGGGGGEKGVEPQRTQSGKMERMWIWGKMKRGGGWVVAVGLAGRLSMRRERRQSGGSGLGYLFIRLIWANAASVSARRALRSSICCCLRSLSALSS